MTARRRRSRWLAEQLRRPSGPAGLLVAQRLNRVNAEMVQACVHACGLSPGDRAADIGFGGGLGLSLLVAAVGPAGRVQGADFSPLMVRRARALFRRDIRRGVLTVTRAAAADLPVPDADLDGAMTANTVYFLPDLGGPFRELARVLRPGGRAVVGLNDPAELARHPAVAYGFVNRPVDAVADALAGAGLTMVGTRSGGDGPDRFHVLVARRD